MLEVNIIPNNYGKIRELGIFSEKCVTTTTVTLELKEGALSILPQVEKKRVDTILWNKICLILNLKVVGLIIFPAITVIFNRYFKKIFLALS
jgi:hypothetical protein